MNFASMLSGVMDLGRRGVSSISSCRTVSTPMRYRFALLLMLVSLSATVANSDAAPLAVSESDQGFLVSDGGRPVLFYQRKPKSVNGAPPRAHYVHPNYGLDGELLTEDSPADHRHHHGIFSAWHQLTVGG